MILRLSQAAMTTCLAATRLPDLKCDGQSWLLHQKAEDNRHLGGCL